MNLRTAARHHTARKMGYSGSSQWEFSHMPSRLMVPIAVDAAPKPQVPPVGILIERTDCMMGASPALVMKSSIDSPKLMTSPNSPPSKVPSSPSPQFGPTQPPNPSPNPSGWPFLSGQFGPVQKP